MGPNRREFLTAAAAASAGLGLDAQQPGRRPARDDAVKTLNPRGRVPLSFIIDDSTCLVNLNKFAVPQFDAAWGEKSRYKQRWREWPDGIPDSFVRRFGEWCAGQGVKGKYSVVPYPACVGRLDRGLPGWAPRDLAASLKLVRELMLPNWDIHPEMVTHTRAIDLKTGHPYPERGPAFQENWDWSVGKSADQLAEYMVYALRILKNVGLPCEGVTTPGGFGNRVLPALSRAAMQSVREVFRAEVPHYFRHVIAAGGRSVAPRVEYASGLDGGDPRCVVSVIACTGDWTGGWDCSRSPKPDQFITPDLKSGRLVEVIDRGEPAVLLCHWTGIYFNGRGLGFKAFQEVVGRLNRRYDNLLWMKPSEISRYWAAKELTAVRREGGTVALQAPFPAKDFTLRLPFAGKTPRLTAAGKPLPLREVGRAVDLKAGTWRRDGNSVVVCFDMPKGKTRLTAAG